MMHRPDSVQCVRRIRFDPEINDGTRTSSPGFKPVAVVFRSDGAEPQCLGEQRSRVLGTRQREGGRVNTPNRVLRRHHRIRPDPGGWCPVGGDELEPEAVRVYETDSLLSEARGHFKKSDLVMGQTITPKVEGSCGYSEGDDANFSAARSAPEGAGPGKEGQQAAGPADLVPEVEVVSARVIEIHSPLHQPQPEESGVEVQIPLGISRDRGDMVNALCSGSHRSS